MNTDLCIGIYANNETLEMAALESGKSAVFMNFPATAVGIDAIKGYLDGYKTSIRLAVSGVADLNLALTLGNLSGRETFIVSCAVANQAIALAHYAVNTA